MIHIVLLLALNLSVLYVFCILPSVFKHSFTGDFILFSFVVVVGVQQTSRMSFVGGYLK